MASVERAGGAAENVMRSVGCEPIASPRSAGYHTMRRRLTLTAASVVVLSLAPSPARGQRLAAPDSAPLSYLAVSQFQHDRWTTADGLPNHAIDWIARSLDGYLWLGTEAGLVRFDGVRFSPFDRSNTPALRGTDFYPTIPLHVDTHGVLWIGPSGGLLRAECGGGPRAAGAAPPGGPSRARRRSRGW